MKWNSPELPEASHVRFPSNDRCLFHPRGVLWIRCHGDVRGNRGRIGGSAHHDIPPFMDHLHAFFIAASGIALLRRAVTTRAAWDVTKVTEKVYGVLISCMQGHFLNGVSPVTSLIKYPVKDSVLYFLRELIRGGKKHLPFVYFRSVYIISYLQFSEQNSRPTRLSELFRGYGRGKVTHSTVSFNEETVVPFQPCI